MGVDGLVGELHSRKRVQIRDIRTPFPPLLTGLDMSSSTESGVTEPPYWILTASAVSYHT